MTLRNVTADEIKQSDLGGNREKPLDGSTWQVIADSINRCTDDDLKIDTCKLWGIDITKPPAVRITFYTEQIVGAFRFAPGEYELRRISDVRTDDQPDF